MLALLGDPDAEAYELLFSFVSIQHKTGFLELVRSYEYFGDEFIDEEFTVPTADEIRAARPLGMVLPEDVLRHATLIAAGMLAASSEEDVLPS